MVARQQPPALKLPQSSPPLLGQERHRRPHLQHLHFLASETAVLTFSNSPNCLDLCVSVGSVKTKQEAADHIHLGKSFPMNQSQNLASSIGRCSCHSLPRKEQRCTCKFIMVVRIELKQSNFLLYIHFQAAEILLVKFQS